MGIMDWLRGPRAATQSAGGGDRINGPEDIERAVRSANVGSSAGVSVTADSAMRTAAVFASVRLIAGAVSNMPLHVKEWVGEDTRFDRPDHALWTVLGRAPNGWQTSVAFRRYMTAQILLRGNAYAQIVRSRDRVLALNPLNPDRMTVKQRDDLSLEYVYRRRDGREVRLAAADVFHVMGLSLDGVTGVSTITYARETIGLSLAQERHGARTFKNAARPSIVLKHPQKLGPEGAANLRASVDAYQQGGEQEGKALVLEEGMTHEALSMTAEDAQWIESRKFSRSDIAMFFGVPPHMIGDTEKASSWGTGIEQMSLGFVKYTLEDYLAEWEQSIARDLITEPTIYARFNRNALLRGDTKARKDFYQSGLQWGWLSPNEVRALEDMNPREGGEAFYPPPNMTDGGQKPDEGDDDDNPKPA